MIVGGYDAPNDQSKQGLYPSTVGIFFKGRCSGTRVADNLFVSAAHCLNGGTPERISLFASNSREFKDLILTNLRIHPLYKNVPLGLHTPDLIMFSVQFMNAAERLTFDKLVTIAPINFGPIQVDQRVTIAGYGCWTEDCEQPGTFKRMKYANSVITSTNAEIELYNDMFFQLGDTTDHPKIDGVIDGGDSGGPVYDQSKQLIGVTVSRFAITGDTNHMWLGHSATLPFIELGLAAKPIDLLYDGEIKNQKFEGEGFYTGPIAKAKRQGKGEMQYICDTRVYSGQWVGDRREGEGTITWPNFNHPEYISYTGGWKADKMHGTGTFDYTLGRMYHGPFVNGLKEGQGTFRMQNGEIEEGIWKNDKREGEFIITAIDGSTRKVFYKADQKVR